MSQPRWWLVDVARPTLAGVDYYTIRAHAERPRGARRAARQLLDSFEQPSPNVAHPNTSATFLDISEVASTLQDHLRTLGRAAFAPTLISIRGDSGPPPNSTTLAEAEVARPEIDINDDQLLSSG